MSSETFSYKGISAGKYVEGSIDALNQEEASFKLKEQKIIITNLVKTKKKLLKIKKRRRIFFWKEKSKTSRCCNFFKTICNYGKGWSTNS